MSKHLKDYTGIVLNNLTALKLHSWDKPKPPKWLWICSCGNEVVVTAKDVVSGHTKSCGCLAKNILIQRNTKHGLSYEHKETYKTWKDMRSRCNSKNNKDFKHYGGRGISYCKDWDSFELFFKDMGSRPKNMTLDRIDVNGNYEPTNCRWADNEQQANNKRNNIKVQFNGKFIGITQLSRILKKSHATISYRIKNNLNPAFEGDYRK